VNFGDLIVIDLNFLVFYVKYYSIILAFSVSDESSFSKANFLQRKERSSLSSENLRYTMILKQKKGLTRTKIFRLTKIVFFLIISILET